MAVSGSKNYSITRSDIVNAALRKIGVYDASESPSGADASNAAVALNLMTKEWVADGIDIWLRQEVTLFLQPDTKSYSLGTTNATTSYVGTSLSSAVSSGSTTIPVASSSGMTAADNIGIKMDDDTIHWSTIASVDSSTQVTIDDATDDDAAEDNKVYAYTTKAGRPQKIITAYRRSTSDIDTEVTLVGEMEYQMQSNKGSSGPPVQVFYRPTLDNGTLYVWPVDGGSTWDKIVLICQYQPDDFDISSNNPQFPIEWGNTLVWGLAAEMASEYGLSEQEQARLWNIAEAKRDKLLDYDVENASFEIALDRRVS